MFHIGHLNLLKNARHECDFLIVGVTTDELCKSGKGVIPTIPENDRLEIVKSIKYVDKVVYQCTYEKFDAFQELKFNKMFVGSDWKGNQKWILLEDEFNKLGVEIVYFEYTSGISSSILRKKIF